VKVRRAAEIEAGRVHESWFVERLMHAAKDGEIRLITSTIALVECISAGESYPEPIADDTKQMFSDFLWSGVYVELVAFDPFVAERARDLRWADNVKIKNADAIHVATALMEGAVEFLSFDQKLKDRYAPLEQQMRGAGMAAIVPSLTAHISEERRSADMFHAG
jgi:predicted nucleic acid-binding protein